MAEKKSGWFYAGIGCAVLAVAGILCFAGGSFWLVRWGKQIERDLKDPVARAEKVRGVLGTEELPEGYYPMMAVSIPLLAEVAILSSEPPASDGQVHDFGERGLIYLKMIRFGQDMDELRDYFEGRTDDSRVLRDNGINIDLDEMIRRGVIREENRNLLYVAQRGSVSTHGARGEGITSLVLVECASDKKNRMIIWFVPDPDPDVPVEELDITGTPAEESTLTAFLDQFRLCR